MTIEIPLSKELLTWWIEHLRYIPEDMRLAAPLPVLLRASGHWFINPQAKTRQGR